MPKELKSGLRLKSAVDTTEVIIVRPPADGGVVACGGQPMVGHDQEVTGGAIDGEHAGGTVLGKRYTEEQSGIEVMCTKAGPGALSLDGRMLAVKEAKPLPSSD